MRAEAERLAEVAERSRAGHLAYLADVLAAEVDDRAERRRHRRIREARFPRIKRLADFDVSASPVDAATIATLASGAYLDKGEPVVLLGDSGTGKSHLLIGMGMAACEQGRAVRYATCAGLVNELVEAADERRLSRLVSRYGRLDLLLLDELGYVQLDTRGAELFFQILTEREEKSSVAVASNLAFQRMGPGHHRPPTGGRHRRPHDVPGPHRRDRDRELPPAHDPQGQDLISGRAGGRRWLRPR